MVTEQGLGGDQQGTQVIRLGILQDAPIRFFGPGRPGQSLPVLPDDVTHIAEFEPIEFRLGHFHTALQHLNQGIRRSEQVPEGIFAGGAVLRRALLPACGEQQYDQ